MNAKLIHILIASLSFLPSIVYSQAEEHGGIQVKEREIKQAGDSLSLDLDICLTDYKIPSSNQIILTPIIESPTGQQEKLSEVYVNGKRRHNLQKRMEKLNGTTTSQSVRAEKKMVNTTIRYKATIPYKDWMDGSTVFLLADDCGCGGVKQQNSVTGIIALPTEPAFTYTYSPSVRLIAPPKEEIKRRAENGTAYIIFPVGSSVIHPERYENRTELGKIEKSLQYVKDEPTAEITAITIQAYASPEGSEKSNLALSKRRADALREYIGDHYGVTSRLVHSEGMGENWKDLPALLNNDPNITDREKIEDIIRRTEGLDARENELKRLSNGSTFRYLVSTHFPKLRRSDYRIEYTLPEFTLEKSKELLLSKPEMLSLAELYHIANTYEVGSEEFIEVFTLAFRLYPDDVIATLNASALSLFRGEYETARKTLEKNSDNPEVWNNLGVAFMGEYRFTEAEEFLLKAKESGSEEAIENLQILAGLKQATDEYNEKKVRYDKYKQ